MLIRAGFRTTCMPAGIAEAIVTGDICLEDAEAAIAMLELAIRSIRRQIEKERSAQDAAKEEHA